MSAYYLSGLQVGMDYYSPLGRGKGWVPFSVPHFHEDKYYEDKGCEISMNIS